MNTPHKIKLAVICHDGQPYGAQQSLWVLLKNLPADQFELYISLAKPGPFKEMLETLPNAKVFEHQRIQWIKHRPSFGLQRIGDIIGLLINCLTRAPKLAKWLKQNQINLVHVNSTVSLEGPLAAKLAGLPCVWHIRELMVENNSRFTPLLGKRLTQKLLTQLPSQIIAISQAVLTNNTYLKSSNKTSLIYNSVEKAAETTQPKSLRSVFTLGYVGRISNTKRFDQVLQVCEKLKTQNIVFKLKVAGLFVDDDYEKVVCNFIQRYQLESNIEFQGFLNPITPFYSEIDCMIFPSTHDSFGRSVIEAMQYGVVVMAANAQALPEIIQHQSNGILYPPENTDQLVNELILLIQDPDGFKTLSQKAIETTEAKFGVTPMVEKVQTVYQKAIEAINLN